MRLVCSNRRLYSCQPRMRHVLAKLNRQTLQAHASTPWGMHQHAHACTHTDLQRMAHARSRWLALTPHSASRASRQPRALTTRRGASGRVARTGDASSCCAPRAGVTACGERLPRQSITQEKQQSRCGEGTSEEIPLSMSLQIRIVPSCEQVTTAELPSGTNCARRPVTYAQMTSRTVHCALSVAPQRQKCCPRGPSARAYVVHTADR